MEGQVILLLPGAGGNRASTLVSADALHRTPFLPVLGSPRFEVGLGLHCAIQISHVSLRNYSGSSLRWEQGVIYLSYGMIHIMAL